jgi:S-ribosylhomocysteine lyase LuxS involved in autoinducer biosynthesis
MSSIINKLGDDKKELLSQLRMRINSLAKDVIEQVRLHRIVYSKGFLMRDFAEITFEAGNVVVTPISPMFKETKSYKIVSDESLEEALEAVREAMNSI